MIYPAFVCLSVRQQLHINLNCSDLYENVTKDISLHKKIPLKCWKLFMSATGSGNLLRMLQHCNIKHCLPLHQTHAHLLPPWPAAALSYL